MRGIKGTKILYHNVSWSPYMVVQHGEYNQHLSTLIDSNCTTGDEHLIIWVTIEILCCIFEANIRLYINDYLNLKKKKTMGLH